MANWAFMVLVLFYIVSVIVGYFIFIKDELKNDGLAGGLFYSGCIMFAAGALVTIFAWGFDWGISILGISFIFYGLLRTRVRKMRTEDIVIATLMIAGGISTFIAYLPIGV